MASKTSRRTTTTTTHSSRVAGSGEETPGTSTGTPSRSRSSQVRSPSPARTTREQEKFQLQNLNDRLAAYIDKVRSLESENSRLLLQVQSTEETITREVTNIKQLYENELGDARKLLDETAKDKARLQIEIGKYKSEADDWQTKFHKRDRECKVADKRVHELEGQITDLQAKLADSENSRKQLEKDYASARSDLATLQRQLATAKKQLEEETLLRVDLENRVQSLKEDLDFKTQVYKQELAETQTRKTTSIDEIDSGIRSEYESKLQDALQAMRAENEEQIHSVRVEVDTLYERKMNDLQGALDRSMSGASTSRDDLITIRRQLDETNSELTKLRSQSLMYEARIRDLESQLEHDRENFAEELKQKDLEISELRSILDDQTKEYADLLEIKIKLDNEIMAYRKLLEGEEERLNISQSSKSPARSTPTSRGQKRKRVAVSESVEQFSQRSSASGYSTSAQAKGSVEINDVDSDGTYVKLYNNSTKDAAIGGWQLVHTAGEDEIPYRFHRSLILKAGQYITVWSANAGKTHSPPSDLVMRGKRWIVSNDMKTALLNSDGEEVATREMSKSVVRTRASEVGYRDDESQDDEDESGHRRKWFFF
ncbi:hypothetical protein ScPMuIL_018273 [Solemya velum]